MYLKNFKKNNKGPKILYLDQNFWIYLAKIHYGKDSDITLSQILNKLYDAVSNGKLVIPINLTNVIEAQKIKNLKRREQLAKFMISLAKGFSFIPYPYIEYKEVENVVLERLGLPLHNIREIGIGKGLLYMISDGTPNFLPEFHSSPIDLINETKGLLAKFILKNLSLKEEFMVDFIINPHRDHDFSSLINKLEDIRTNGYKTKDKKLRKIIGISHYILNSIAGLFYQACSKNNLDPYSFRFNEENKIYDFLKKLPFFYTQYLLFKGLDNSVDHKITSNDIQDIRSFSFALPYCDYVAGENYVISLAKRNGVNKLYSTRLFTKSDFVNIEGELDKLEV